MTVATQPDLTVAINTAMQRLREARDDGDPSHNTARCKGCGICVIERHLNRLLDKLPRQENT